NLKGDEARAWESFVKFKEFSKEAPENMKLYNSAYQKAGFKGVLRQEIVLSEKAFDEYHNQWSLYIAACMSAQIAEKEKALGYLLKIDENPTISLTGIGVDPYFDSLHDDLRFVELERKVDLKDYLIL